MKRLTLTAWLLLALAATPPGHSEDAPAVLPKGGKGAEVSFSVSSSRNKSGHRLIKTSMATRGAEDEVSNIKVVHSKKIEHGIVVLQLQTEVVVAETPLRRGPAAERSQYTPVPTLRSAYRLYLTPRSWVEARAVCDADGAYLAVPNSAEEAKHIANVFSAAPSTVVGADFSHVAHIGFSDLVKDGTYMTIFGETLQEAGYATWASNQPNNAPHKGDKRSDCGGIERNGGLNDVPCNSACAFVCEAPL